MVETQDIWSFDIQQIQSLKNQADELLGAPKNTQYYTEGVSTKTDISVGLDKILLKQEQAITPENRIKTYRESSLEMNSIEEKINSLKELVALSRTNRGILGFIGNLQTISLWGIFLVITAAFIFLAFYAKASTNNTEQVINDSLTKENIETTRKSTTISYRHKKQNLKTGHKMIRMVSIILLVSSISAAVYEANREADYSVSVS